MEIKIVITLNIRGESPVGLWRLFIRDRSPERHSANGLSKMVPVGEIGEMKIFFHGTETEPEIQKMALKEKNFQTLESEQDPKEDDEVSMVSPSSLFSQEQVSPIQNE